jgi:Tol biopolymer transport system component
MSGRPIRPDDETLRDLLVEEPRRELAFEVADALGTLIRATPQERPFLKVGGRGIFRPIAQARVVRLLVVAALVLAAVVALLVVGAPREPLLPGNGLVVLGSDRAGLYLADPAGGATRQLAAPWQANPSGRTNRSDLIAVSPRGDRLAYIVAAVDGWAIPILELPSGTRLAEVRDDGREMLPEWRMRWSHDGGRLFLEATVAGLGRIVAADAATGALVDVGDPNRVARDVAPSPVDGRVAFVQTSSPFDDDYRLVIHDPASGATTEPLAAMAEAAALAADPAWSPDGRALAMTVTRADGSSAIARVGDDGSGYAVITPWIDGWPVAQWSPDGSELLVVIVPQGGREADIYTNDAQLAEAVLVAPDGADWRPIVQRACSNVAWSPDGGSIVYERGTCDGAGGAAEVRIVGADGSGDRAVWTGDSRLTSRLSIAWQPLP